MKKLTWADPPSQTAFPIAQPGYPMIYASAFATLIFAVMQLKFLALIGLLFTIFVCYFFRDPDRLTPDEPGAVICPADGKIIKAHTVDSNPFLDGPRTKISIFMSPFNVHVNRIPHDGTVREIVYNPGKFIRANLDEASDENEHNALIIRTPEEIDICVVQVSGYVARRIICAVKENDVVERGRRFGMICLGSRLDVYLPADFQPDVSLGDKVKAGTSILGYLK